MSASPFLNRGLRVALPLLLAGSITIWACVGGPQHLPNTWWAGQGPVISHQNFPADCALCHTTRDWRTLKEDFQFDHAVETGVALAGAHSTAQCLRCHNDRGPVAVFAQRGCAGCHEDVHQGQLGGNCRNCHEEHDWRPQGQIAEHQQTRFPLLGAHAATTCERCHPGIGSGAIEVLSIDCAGCHQDDLARAQNPDHLAQGWVQDCETCHLPTRWTGAGFRHEGFQLTGQHLVVDCEACHVGGVFSALPTDCFACHDQDYQLALDPDHPGLGFPQDCERCHGTFAWLPAKFNHYWVGSNCVDCHLAEYQATTDPDHLASGFSQQCADCHRTNTWVPANFDHQGITSGCVDCHLDDFQATNDPNHQAAGFPQDCEICHNTNTWQGATFDHDFPITSGDHKNLDCVDCHLVPGNYASFSCIDCHEHNKSDMDQEHQGESGYVYASQACLQCHPDGKE